MRASACKLRQEAKLELHWGSAALGKDGSARGEDLHCCTPPPPRCRFFPQVRRTSCPIDSVGQSRAWNPFARRDPPCCGWPSSSALHCRAGPGRAPPSAPAASQAGSVPPSFTHRPGRTPRGRRQRRPCAGAGPPGPGCGRPARSAARRPAARGSTGSRRPTLAPR